MDKSEIIKGLMLAADDWTCRAQPDQLLRVLLRGGLSASIDDEDGLITMAVRLVDRRGQLFGIGVLNADLHRDEALALYAHAWDASEPPVTNALQAAWLAGDRIALREARRHLQAEIAESANLFEEVVDAWLLTRQP